LQYVVGGFVGPQLPREIIDINDSAVLTDGRIVLVGWSTPDPFLPVDIYSKTYDPATGELSEATIVNQALDGTQLFAKVTALDAGRFIVTWQDLDQGTIMARQFLQSGIGGDEFQFPVEVIGRTPDGTLVGARHSNLPDGTFEVVLQEFTVTWGAQRPAGDGASDSITAFSRADTMDALEADRGFRSFAERHELHENRAEGHGQGNNVQIALIGTGPHLTATDFIV
jgi:hypothetical protein